MDSSFCSVHMENQPCSQIYCPSIFCPLMKLSKELARTENRSKIKLYSLIMKCIILTKRQLIIVYADCDKKPNRYKLRNSNSGSTDYSLILVKKPQKGLIPTSNQLFKILNLTIQYLYNSTLLKDLDANVAKSKIITTYNQLIQLQNIMQFIKRITIQEYKSSRLCNP